MIGLGDPERIVIDCAGDEWNISGPDGAVRTIAAPSGVADFVAPVEATRRWATWLSEAVSGGPPVRTWTVLAPSVFGASRCGIVAAGAASLGADATVMPRSEALVQVAGLLYCRRALVVECRGPKAQAHLLDFVDGNWQAVAAASDADPVAAVLALIDDRVDQALIDADDETAARVRDALAQAKLWRVVRIEAADVLPALRAPQPQPQLQPEPVQPPLRHRRRWVAAVAGLATVAAAAVACLPARVSAPERPAPPPETFVQVSFDGAVVDLPQGWAVTEPAPGRRVAEAEDGRRVTVVRTRLRAPSDRAAVAAELQAALQRRGDQRISNLNPDGAVAGRAVIGYRERLSAERVVDWYVVVDGTAQLSVGCEAGRTAAPLAGACERAVASVRPD